MYYQNLTQEFAKLCQGWAENSTTANAKSVQFQQVLEQTGNDASLVNLLQLLNCAVSHLESGEVYCEIGTTDQGITLIGALLNHPHHSAYAVFSNLDLEGFEEYPEQLTRNLQQFDLDDQVIFCFQDSEEFLLELRELETEGKIGVYFYTNAVDYRSVLMGLLLVTPSLAGQAVLIVDQVRPGSLAYQAVWDFIAVHPECQVLWQPPSEIQASHFPNGIMVLSWDIARKQNYGISDLLQQRQLSVIHSLQTLEVTESSEQQVQVLYETALSFHEQGELESARQTYQDLLQLQPEHPEAWLNLGILQYDLQDYSSAVQSLGQSLELDDEEAYGHYYMGLCLEKIHQLGQAVTAYQKAIELDPDLIDAYNNLGNIWYQQGEFAEAEMYYRAAISTDPYFWGSYLNLGNVLFEQNQLDEAIETYQTALQFNPEESLILDNLQIAAHLKEHPTQNSYRLAEKFYHQRKYESAIEHYQNYLEHEEGNEEIYLNLADCFHQLRDSSSSIQTLQKAVQYYPNSAKINFTLITSLLHQGKAEETMHQAELSSENIPNEYAFKLLKYLLVPMLYQTPKQIGFYRHRFEQGLQQLVQETDLSTPKARQNCLHGISNYTNFYLAYQAHNVVESQATYGNLVHQIMRANYPEWTQSLPLPPVGDKIRVGYVSNYLHSYSGTLWLTGWLKHHNPEDFEIYCYYTGNSPDPVTQRFQQFSDVFHHVPGDFTTACQQILADQLHILVYPELGMDPPTFQRAALRLAPIQCTAWGHPVTTGLPTVDYFLSSELMEPDNAQEHYSETLIRLPNIGVAYPHPKDIPSLTKTRSDFDLPEDAVIYFCCQAPFKYLPQYDYLLPEIARQVSQAKFVFLRGELLFDRLESVFNRYSLRSTDYCLHLVIPERSDYLMLNLLSDVFLDTFTWSGGNTSLEAIACGLPIVTCPGEFMRGRHADSFLKMLGVTETIARNESEYVEIAVRLGQDSVWRKEIADRIYQSQERLFEDVICVGGLENFYRQAVECYPKTVISVD
ncbi:MAG: tetratricopeptide repeat protein [Microcoleaceae cyanobacterium]